MLVYFLFRLDFGFYFRLAVLMIMLKIMPAMLRKWVIVVTLKSPIMLIEELRALRLLPYCYFARLSMNRFWLSGYKWVCCPWIAYQSARGAWKCASLHLYASYAQTQGGICHFRMVMLMCTPKIMLANKCYSNTSKYIFFVMLKTSNYATRIASIINATLKQLRLEIKSNLSRISTSCLWS